MFRISLAKLWILVFVVASFAQVTAEGTSDGSGPYFRVGERATYSISFGRYEDAGLAEFSVVSKGVIEGHDAFEIRSRVKTYDLVSAAFFFVDETRVDFVSAANHTPLYSVRKVFEGLAPAETKKNFLPDQSAQFDLLTLLFAIRNSRQGGQFSFIESEKNYRLSFDVGPKVRIQTDAGNFETNELRIESSFFGERSWTDVKLSVTADEKSLPVLFSANTPRGEIRIKLASYKLVAPPQPAIQLPPSNVPKAIPVPVPRPTRTPVPYADNEPLSNDLPFALGESLTFEVKDDNQKIGSVILRLKERRLFFGTDSVLLTAEVAEVEKNSKSNLLVVGDSMLCYMDPVTLVPLRTEVKATGHWSAFDQTAQYDQGRGIITNEKFGAIDVPVGTHSVLSLAFAIRAFNLRQSRDASNPVNDTRVAVFSDARALIWTLRTTSGEKLTFDGVKLPTQVVSIITEDPSIDSKNPRVWLSADAQRLPLRLSFGTLRADLVVVSHS